MMLPMDLNLMKHPPAKYVISNEPKRTDTISVSVKAKLFGKLLAFLVPQDCDVEIRDQAQHSMV